METKNCPYCGETIQANSATCPYCNEPINRESISEPIAPLSPSAIEADFERPIMADGPSPKRNHIGIIIFAIVIVLVIVISAFVIHQHNKKVALSEFISAINSMNPPLQHANVAGIIGSSIGFSMDLFINNGAVSGKEHYNSQPAEILLNVSGTLDTNGNMTLVEFSKQGQAGTFFGIITSGLEKTYSGTFTNRKGKEYPFSASITYQ